MHFNWEAPGSCSVDPRVNESDSSPHGGELLLVKQWAEIRPSCLKDFEEEVVWRAFIEFNMPEKVIRAEWDSSSPLVKIYDETNGQNNLRAKHRKFFPLH